jgi:hypothetical protein
MWLTSIVRECLCNVRNLCTAGIFTPPRGWQDSRCHLCTQPAYSLPHVVDRIHGATSVHSRHIHSRTWLAGFTVPPLYTAGIFTPARGWQDSRCHLCTQPAYSLPHVVDRIHGATSVHSRHIHSRTRPSLPRARPFGATVCRSGSRKKTQLTIVTQCKWLKEVTRKYRPEMLCRHRDFLLVPVLYILLQYRSVENS